MSDIHQAIENLQEKWSSSCRNDDKLNNAWRNCEHLLSEGTIQSLEASAELIVRMDWITGLTTWLSYSKKGGWTLSPAILPEERCFYAFVLMYCRNKSLEIGEYNWILMWDSQFDWKNISIHAGSVPMLSEVPEWLMEHLVLGLMQEVLVSPKDGLDIDELDIDHSFQIMMYPLSQIVVETLLSFNPSQNNGFLNPVDCISWHDAAEICNRLSEVFDLPMAYIFDDQKEPTLIPKSDGFRLPTEIEWTYAARAHEQPGWKFRFMEGRHVR